MVSRMREGEGVGTGDHKEPVSKVGHARGSALLDSGFRRNDGVFAAFRNQHSSEYTDLVRMSWLKQWEWDF